MLNPYEVLGVSVNATVDEIKKARNRLMRIYHTDKNSKTADKAKEINAAYDELVTKDGRRLYPSIEPTASSAPQSSDNANTYTYSHASTSPPESASTLFQSAFNNRDWQACLNVFNQYPGLYVGSDQVNAVLREVHSRKIYSDVTSEKMFEALFDLMISSLFLKKIYSNELLISAILGGNDVFIKKAAAFVIEARTPIYGSTILDMFRNDSTNPRVVRNEGHFKSLLCVMNAALECNTNLGLDVFNEVTKDDFFMGSEGAIALCLINAYRCSLTTFSYDALLASVFNVKEVKVFNAVIELLDERKKNLYFSQNGLKNIFKSIKLLSASAAIQRVEKFLTIILTKSDVDKAPLLNHLMDTPTLHSLLLPTISKIKLLEYVWLIGDELIDKALSLPSTCMDREAVIFSVYFLLCKTNYGFFDRPLSKLPKTIKLDTLIKVLGIDEKDDRFECRCEILKRLKLNIDEGIFTELIKPQSTLGHSLMTDRIKTMVDLFKATKSKLTENVLIEFANHSAMNPYLPLIIEGIDASGYPISNSTLRSILDKLPAQKVSFLPQKIKQQINGIREFDRDFKANLVDLSIQARNLRERDEITAYQAAHHLHSQLDNHYSSYLKNQTKAGYQQFLAKCRADIRVAAVVLKEHRGLKNILGNIILAIVGLGVIYGVACGINYAINGRFFFQFETRSGAVLDKSERLLDHCKP